MIKGIFIGVIGVALVVDRIFLTQELKWQKRKYVILQDHYNAFSDRVLAEEENVAS